MKKDNQSCLHEIVLLGFSDFQSMRELLFCLVVMFYFMTLMGNSLILILIILNPTLHTPMYFFLWNLSFLEIGYTSTISPKMLVDILSDNQTISFWGCGCQMCFFILFGLTECCLLCVMSYDRYVAICKPLQYPYIMKYRKCAKLAAVSWVIGVFVSLGQSVSIFTLPFCGSNRISHFFCDIKHVLKLASTDTYKDELAIAIIVALIILTPLLLILFSYILILSTIFNIPGAKNRRKAFSTCFSHLTVVCIFYGTAIVTYIHPNSEYSMDSSRFLGLLYTVVTPSLNPLIYSLRNKEIKAAFKKSVGRKQVSFME
ncbi:olfactory receptor 10A4-like [Pantherophis guttatus]|uniref:Olfactory receptor n=1 Tax=Pantherophis guttatus TaxID=94885 RepID=A0A6P9BVX0_PANGU|nr:olfactory receptor 10A4-like [Pantherophis guttatus]XP_034275748.1 olfactory receptor 10A4-like [Pantherophis guttatus]XP_060548827.1 olfactory receptor 10A4-like [Pantherophis guttatus]XP_060548828.1 olfactory receptor 10A4-like [Pantherophis guttatus]